MSYQLYRNTTLGNTLQESLDELIQVSTVNGRIQYSVAQGCTSCVVGIRSLVKLRFTYILKFCKKI